MAETAFEREVRGFMAKMTEEMAEIRTKMDHYDGETGEIRDNKCISHMTWT